MVQLLTIREKLKSFISRYEGYVRPASKFLLCLVIFIIINSKVGFAAKLTNPALAVIVSLAASFLPTNFIIVISGLFILLHMYALSLECLIVVGAMMVLMFLMFYRFSPNDTILLLFTPICFACGVPYIMPLSAGLVGAATSVVSIGCGTVIYYILTFIAKNEASLKGLDNESVAVKLRFLLDEILYNKELLMVIVAFTVTIIVVYIIRRLSVDHAWTIAIVTGTLTDMLIILVGDLKYGTYISVIGLIFGSIVAVLAVIVIKFFVFNIDYSRTERVQFEDDEYYYYVKAVPKNTVSIGEKQVKKIKGQGEPRRRRLAPSVSERTHMTEEQDAQVYRVRRSATTRPQTSKNANKAKNSGNKNISRRVIMPDETIENGRIVSGRDSVSGSGLTEIERAAAAKARAARANKNRK